MEQRQKTYAELIPELKDWNRGNGIDVEAWLRCVGSFEHAIAYTHLFWPDFVEHDDCILTSGFTEAGYQAWMQQTRGNRRAVESVINHRHILDLFGDPKLQPTRDQLVYVGRALKEIWSAKLRRDFPTRDITVSFPEGEYSELIDYEITFFQNEHTV